jgi:hypothetical protein
MLRCEIKLQAIPGSVLGNLGVSRTGLAGREATRQAAGSKLEPAALKLARMLI